MGFCTDEEHKEFLRAMPLFEEVLLRSGIYLMKYWFSVNVEEQEMRFRQRMRGPTKRSKRRSMNVESRKRWVESSMAKDAMFAKTDTRPAPWFAVDADDKKKARLNCIAHLLQQIDYIDLTPVEIELPPRQEDLGYKRPRISKQRFVPKGY